MAYASSIASSIVSLFTYMQNLGATVNLPKFDMPEQVTKVIQVFTKFLHTLLNLIPQIPAFDIRAQLVILALGIPLVLDIIFIWFVNPFFKTLTHLLDLLVLVVLAMLITQGIIQNWTVGKTICLAMGGVYFLFRILYYFLRRKKVNQKQSLNKYTKHICKLYMTCVIPGVHTKYDEETLQEDIRQYSKSVEYKAKKPKVFPSIVMFILMAFLIVVSLWSIDVIKIKYRCPSGLAAFLPYFGFTFAVLLLFILILMLTKCGREFIMLFKHFANRWGLRLLMLFLDLLYIPIITNLVTLLTPTHFTCGEGYYLQYQRRAAANENGVLFDYVNHTWECRQCYATLVSSRPECQAACAGEREWRMMGALNLRIVDDVIRVSGGILLFTVGAFLVGIPVLWRVIIRRNRSCVKRINVYGDNFESKWKAVVHKLESTGIFLFSIYKFPCSNWSIVLITIKLLVMVITTIAGRVNTNAYWALPCLYLICIICTVKIRPFIYPANQILNVILYILNFFFSLLPMFPYFNVTIPANVTLYISLALVVIPILSILSLLFVPGTVFMKDDPSFLTRKEIKKLKKKNEAAAKGETNSRKSHGSKGQKGSHGHSKQDDRNHGHSRRDDRHSRPDDRRRTKDDEEDDGKQDLGQDAVGFDGEDPFENLDFETGKLLLKDIRRAAATPDIQVRNNCEIPEGYMDSINYRYRVLMGETKKPKNGRVAQRLRHTRAFTISKRLIYNRCQQMYKMIDVILDGSTIELLTKTLNAVMLVGACAFGWYVGALLGNSNTTENIFCG